ncbi:MAG: murein biosynthesis integral membrane protein MurJ [Acidobacteria bacterium]|nr:murein biosynthesis integral membrane protein MurJ [Acidobacteriota bacterium]
MAHSLGKKIGIASLIMMGSVFLSRVIGLLREIVVAKIGGVEAAVDAYKTAFMIPDIFNHFTASGFLAITFIPIFSEYLSRDRESDGWRIFNIILNSYGVLLLFLVAIGMVFTPEFIDIAASGNNDPEYRSQVVRMTRIIIPAQLFHMTGGLFMAVQYAKEKFLIPALSPLIYNLGIILGGLVLGRYIGMEGFCWGVLAGAFLGPFLLQMWGAGRVGMKYSLRFGLRSPDFSRYLRLTVPLMFGLTMMFSMDIFFRFFGNYLSEGTVAALDYAKIIMLIPAGLFGQAVGTASFPFMARLAVENRIMEMNRIINAALRYLALVIPISIMMIVVRHELVRILYQRGKFDADATTLTAGILVFLLPCAFAVTSYTVVVRGYYAMQNTMFPAIFLTIAVVCSLPVYWFAMQWIGAHGIALAVSVSVIFQVILLYILWNRRTGNRESRSVFYLYAKIILISIPVGILAEWFRRWAFAGSGSLGFAQAFWICCVIGGGYCLLLIIGGYLMKIEEIKMLIQKFLHRRSLL